MHTKIEQLEALAGHLLDGYRGLGARYALLSPMLFDADVTERHGSGKQWRGFALIRDSLFLGCVQDIAKYSLDDYRRSPSIQNVMRLLKEPLVRKELRARYAAWSAPLMQPETDPDVLEAMRHWEVEEVSKRGAEFEQQWLELRALWPTFSTSPTMKKLATIRNSSPPTSSCNSLLTSTRSWTSPPWASSGMTSRR